MMNCLLFCMLIFNAHCQHDVSYVLVVINEASHYPEAALSEEVFLGNQEYQDFRRNPGQLTKAGAIQSYEFGKSLRKKYANFSLHARLISSQHTLSSFLRGFHNASSNELDISNVTISFRGYCNYASTLKSRFDFFAKADEDISSLLIYLAKNCETTSSIEDSSNILDNWILMKDLKIEPPKFFNDQFDLMSKIKNQYETLCLRDRICSDLTVGWINSELKNFRSYSEPESIILNVFDCETFLIWVKNFNPNFTCGSMSGISIEFSSDGVIRSIDEHHSINDSVGISKSYCSSQCANSVDQIFPLPKLDYSLCNSASSYIYNFIMYEYINLIIALKIYQGY